MSILDDTPYIPKKPNGIEMFFSYTSDKKHAEIDEKAILESILDRYPGLASYTEVKDQKKIFLEILQDSVFIFTLIDYYAIDIEYILKIIAKNYPQIFNSSIFFKKINSIIELNEYSNE